MTANELRKILSTKYDLVCSIGSDCGCAGHLVRNRLRRASYPLDWVGTWYNGIVGVAHLVESDFSGFLQLENLRREPNPPRAAQDDHDHDYYHDVGLRIDTAHDFPVDVSLEEAYPDVRVKYDRRICRFVRVGQVVSMYAIRLLDLARLSVAGRHLSRGGDLSREVSGAANRLAGDAERRSAGDYR